MHAAARRALVIALAALLAALAFAPTASAGTTRLEKAVTAKGIKDHLERFQSIANRYGGNRSSGTDGYDASADYVVRRLERAGYQVRRQRFSFDLYEEQAPAEFQQLTPTPTTYQTGDENADFFSMEYSGSGDVSAPVTPVDVDLPPPPEPGSDSGCEASDFAGFPAGDIALIQRGTCDFGQKAKNAADAGASAVIIFNEGQEGRTDTLNGTLGDFRPGIPTIGTTFAIGEELATAENASARVAVTATITTSRTLNVLANTRTGRKGRTVMAGAHLDSVPEGPGINDNGSGTAAILETALQMKRLGIEPRNRVRFAFWGAEESGLVGSDHYIAELSQRQYEDIELYLNFDMVGSPNFVRFVYDGDGDAFGTQGPAGSGRIERTFTRYFRSKGQASEETAFDGRSDYFGFIGVGIPAGGLFSGAEGEKTEEQAEDYGGTAGVAYDPCYHLACDTIANPSMTALSQFSNAIAHATLRYARRKQGLGDNAERASRARAGRSARRDAEFLGSHERN